MYMIQLIVLASTLFCSVSSFGEIGKLLLIRRRQLGERSGKIVDDEATKAMVLSKVAEWRDAPKVKNLVFIKKWVVINKHATIYQIEYTSTNGNTCEAVLMKTSQPEFLEVRYVHEIECYKPEAGKPKKLDGEVVKDDATKEVIRKEVESWKGSHLDHIMDITHKVEGNADIYNIRYKATDGGTCEVEYKVEKVGSETTNSHVFNCHKEETKTKHVTAVLDEDEPLFGPNEHAEDNVHRLEKIHRRQLHRRKKKKKKKRKKKKMTVKRSYGPEAFADYEQNVRDVWPEEGRRG